MSKFHNRSITYAPESSGGFTIVELLIVIVIIAILAAITIVSYNGIQKHTAQSIVKDALSNTASALKAAAVDSNSYSIIPANVTVARDVGLALTELTPPATSTSSFCLNGVHSKYHDVQYHITESSSVEEGLCAGAVITETIVGNYAPGSGSSGGPEAPPSLGYVPITAGQVAGDKYGFKATTNNTWTQVTLSWDAPATDVVKFELQTRNSPTAAWAYRSPITGGTTANVCASSSCTIAAASRSINWTDTGYAVPTQAGSSYQYQLRTCTTLASTNCSEWSIITLANPLQDNSPIPPVTNFAVAPSSDWTSVSMHWDISPQYATNFASQKYELQSRRSSTDPWTYRLSGSGATTSNQCGSSTCTIPVATTSTTWTNAGFAVPYQPGTTYGYRIRACATGVSLYCGAWNEISLANPIQLGSPIPSMTHFTVTPNSDWTLLTLTWDAAPAFAAVPSGQKYEIQSRRNATEAWSYRLRGSGATTSNGCDSTTCNTSGALTSTTWNSTGYAIPPAGQTYDYRIRTCADTSTTYCGAWTTFSLTR